MRTMPLDMIVAAGTEYTVDKPYCLVIRRIGTDISGGTTIKIDGKEAGTYDSTVAPLRETTSGSLGPLDLKNLFYVVPPERKYEFSGSGNVRIIGDLIILEPGETVPADLLARYRDQHLHYFDLISDSYSFGGATSWAANSEVEVYSKQLESFEKLIFNRLAIFSQSGITYSTGDIGVLILIDDVPLYNRDSNTGQVGIDFDAFVITTDRLEHFSFEKTPLEILPDHKITIKAKNVSGSALSLSSASITFKAVAEYLKYKV